MHVSVIFNCSENNHSRNSDISASKLRRDGKILEDSLDIKGTVADVDDFAKF